jgi:hypothetical protein
VGVENGGELAIQVPCSHGRDPCGLERNGSDLIYIKETREYLIFDARTASTN